MFECELALFLLVAVVIDLGETDFAIFDTGDLNELIDNATSLDEPRDTAGHGTHVASLAAGNGLGSGGRYVGVAPEASLIVVRATRGVGGVIRDADALLATRFVFDQAEAMGLPAVANLSLGVLDQSLQLTWDCPDDPIVTGVLILRAEGLPPAGPQVGETVFDGPGETVTDEGLRNGTRYCYGAFAYDAAGRFAEEATACGVPGPNRKPPMPELLSPASGAATTMTSKSTPASVQFV